MYCDNCGKELDDNAAFCSNCGKQLNKKNKNIYISLILTFIITGLGSVYAGQTRKGVILFIVRIFFGIMGLFLNIFAAISVLVWAYAFYEAYKDVQTANGNTNPKLLNDFKKWNGNKKIIAVIIVLVILLITVYGFTGLLVPHTSYSDADTSTHYYTPSTSSSSSSSGSSHYGGVDDSPSTIAKNDPDWYYEHYEYGDNPDIDDYLESEGYD